MKLPTYLLEIKFDNKVKIPKFMKFSCEFKVKQNYFSSYKILPAMNLNLTEKNINNVSQLNKSHK